MFACRVCENTQYELVSGHYYCKTCGTLSEDHHEQDVKEMEVMDGKLRGLVRKVREGKKSTVNRDLGRPWTIYEAYQCIILAQCDALISLGAKADLKEIVFTVWTNYLSKIKIAFSREEKVVPDIVMKSGFGRRRELHSGTLEKPWNRSRKYGKKSGNYPSDPGHDVNADSKEEKVGNKRKRDCDSESDSDDDSTTFVKPNNGNKHIKKSIEWMNLKKTAVFCFIGLQYTNPEILLVQFVRWIYEGRVPFLSTTHLLNADMVLSLDDQFLFLPVPVTVQSVIEEMDKFTRYVPINSIPLPDLTLMAKELVKRIHLPDELTVVCARFIQKLPFKSTVANNYPKIEFVAMQYIALTLKMMFGLDDNMEHQLSEYSEEAQSIIGSEGNVFVWSQWRAYQMEKEKTDYNLYRDFTRERNYKSRHLEEILESFTKFHREDRRVCIKRKNDEKKHESKMEGLTNPITMAIAGSKMKKDPSDSSQDQESIQQKFTESTLSHIVDFDAFKNKFRDITDKSSRKALQHRRKKILKNMVYFKFTSGDEQAFYKDRPNSYSWLVQFLSDFVGYPAVDLDSNVVALENRLKIMV